MLVGFTDAWLQNKWLLWGAGPALSSVLGFFTAAAVLELLLSSGLFDNALITYASSNETARKQLLRATHQRLPFTKQVVGCIKYMFGPSMAANAVGMTVLMTWATGGREESWLAASAAAALWQFVALMVIGDLGLYWGHRVQHEFKFLWKLHAKHHAIDTPSPFSTLFIDPTDATLQGAVPFGVAAVLVCPAPAVLYFYLAVRMAENALNHSGIDSPVLDLVTLKCMPLRAPVSFHDAHHKYSNHAFNAKNYGESFWVWDWMFGTISPLSGRAGAANSPAARPGAHGVYLLDNGDKVD